MTVGIIGINQYPEHLNWACPLHCFAFQKYLSNIGIESKVLDYRPDNVVDFDFDNPVESYARRIIKCANRINENTNAEINIEILENKLKNRELIEKGYFNKAKNVSDITVQNCIHSAEKNVELYNGLRELEAERGRRTEKMRQFCKKNIVFTEEKYDSKALEVEDPGFDTYICPTDVLWRVTGKNSYEKSFFLAKEAFRGKGKIAYAVSRGVFEGYTPELEAQLIEHIEDFNYVSVREPDLKQFIETRTTQNAPLVVDPVFLHDKAFWHNIAKKPQERNYVLLYYVMEKANDTVAMAIDYAKEKNLKIVELSDRPLKQGKIVSDEVEVINKYDIGPEEWLGYIEGAEYVFTNSFHACCFSIIFNKTFKAGKRAGTKVSSLIQRMGVVDNTKYEEIGSNYLPVEINWSKVERVLSQNIKKSQEFLQEALTNTAMGRSARKDKKSGLRFRYNACYDIIYNSGCKKEKIDKAYDGAYDTKGGSLEYREHQEHANDGKTLLGENLYTSREKVFKGWKIRIKLDNKKKDNNWYWYMLDGSLVNENQLETSLYQPVVLKEGTMIPRLPIETILYEQHGGIKEKGRYFLKKKPIKLLLVAVAVWR